MRSYPRNSPEAAARNLSLAALADGRLPSVEVQALDAVDVYAQLGLHRLQMQEVMRALCQDLLSHAKLKEQGDIHAATVCRLAPALMAELVH